MISEKLEKSTFLTQRNQKYAKKTPPQLCTCFFLLNLSDMVRVPGCLYLFGDRFSLGPDPINLLVQLLSLFFCSALFILLISFPVKYYIVYDVSLSKRNLRNFEVLFDTFKLVCLSFQLLQCSLKFRIAATTNVKKKKN